MSSVSGNTPEEIKFRKVYNMLTNSVDFKNIFVDLFGVSPLFNVKFEITDVPQTINNGHIDGICYMYKYPNNLSPFNIIQIDRSHLLTKSTAKIALTILHECIHAYLNVKFLNPSFGMNIETINNMDFQTCVNTYYNGFSGNQTQHSFFVDNMIPKMATILNQIKNLLFTQEQILSVENPEPNSVIYGVTNTNPSVKNYSIILPWNWSDYFSHFSYNGLENCSSYSSIYPAGSPNSLNYLQYISIGIFRLNQ